MVEDTSGELSVTADMRDAASAQDRLARPDNRRGDTQAVGELALQPDPIKGGREPKRRGARSVKGTVLFDTHNTAPRVRRKDSSLLTIPKEAASNSRPNGKIRKAHEKMGVHKLGLSFAPANPA